MNYDGFIPHFFINDTAREYEEYAKEKTSNTFVKMNKLLGIALNIAIPLVLLLVFHLTISQYILAFIAFDAIQIVLNFILIKIFLGVKGLSWITSKGKFIKKIENMSPSEIEAFKNDFRKNQAFAQEKLNIINKKIEEYKMFNNIETSSFNRENIAFVEEMILKLKNYDNIKWIKNEFEKIIEKSMALLDIVKEDTDSVKDIINTYNIYADELLNIVNQYEDMDEEQQERYKDRIKDLITTFYEHLEDLEQKITSYREHNIERDIDFLMKKLEETGEDEGNV